MIGLDGGQLKVEFVNPEVVRMQYVPEGKVEKTADGDLMVSDMASRKQS